MKSDAKSIFESKTVWVNAGFVIVAVAAVLADPVQYGPEVAKWAAVILAVANIFLRMVTKGPVTIKKQKK